MPVFLHRIDVEIGTLFTSELRALIMKQLKSLSSFPRFDEI